jgi:DnaJ-class molecular chaperone
MGKEVRKMKHPVKCPKCKGSGEVERKDLPPMLKGPLAFGIRQNDVCPVCDGVGYVEG